MTYSVVQKSVKDAQKVDNEVALNTIVVQQLLDSLTSKQIMSVIKGGNTADGSDRRVDNLLSLGVQETNGGVP